MVLVLAMMKLHEFSINKIWIVFSLIVLILGGYAIYGKIINILDLSKEQTRCLYTSFFVISILAEVICLITLYLGVSDLKQIRLAEEQRTV